MSWKVWPVGRCLALLMAMAVLCMGCTGADASKCSTCKSLISRFVEGMDKTKANGFGGGNTDWEERALGAYATSETRLEEVLEQACSSDKDHACHMQLEESEEAIEEWWRNRDVSKDAEAEDALRHLVCEETLHVCCPSGRYGPKCKPCPGGEDTPCNNHGRCKGEGTTSGSGKCACHAGYKGKACNKCKKGYYKSPATGGEGEAVPSSVHCIKCHPSCKACDGPEPSSCKECAEGYVYESGRGCVDVDECQTGAFKCASDQYCHNTPGNYTCRSCHAACDRMHGCTGGMAADCRECARGHRRAVEGDEASDCVDIDECAEGIKVCEVGKFCANGPGWSECRACHDACDPRAGCEGAGAAKCRACSTGYTLKPSGIGCEDVDECAREPSPCAAADMQCTNTEGSFTCACPDGQHEEDGKCVEDTVESSEGTEQEQQRDEL